MSAVVLNVELCAKHKQMIEDEVTRRGWSYLRSETDEVARKRFEAALDPDAPFTRDNFDPFIMSSYAIIHQAMTTPILAAELVQCVGKGAQEIVCPVCVCDLEHWIEPAMNDCENIIGGWKRTDN